MSGGTVCQSCHRQLSIGEGCPDCEPKRCEHLHIDDYREAQKPDSDGIYHDLEHCKDCGLWLTRLTRERPSHVRVVAIPPMQLLSDDAIRNLERLAPSAPCCWIDQLSHVDARAAACDPMDDHDMVRIKRNDLRALLDDRDRLAALVGTTAPTAPFAACCKNCGKSPRLEVGPVNDVMNLSVTPTCECHPSRTDLRGFNIWWVPVGTTADAPAPETEGDDARSQFWRAVRAEIDHAYAKHGREPWGRHEFFAIMREEVDEAWDDIKADAATENLLKEVVQIAAMCLRYAETGDRYRGEHPAIPMRVPSAGAPATPATEEGKDNAK